MDSVTAFLASGQALLVKGELQKARVQFRNAVQVDPTQAEPFYQLALIDEQQQNWKEMYANLSTAVGLEPEHIDANLKLGQLYLLSGEYDEVRERVEQVLVLDSHNEAALILRASLYIKQQYYTLAENDLRLILEHNSHQIQALSTQAILYKEQGKFQQALSILDKALAIDENNLSLLMMKVAIYEIAHDDDKIIDLYQDFLQRHPDNLLITQSLARLLSRQGHYLQAKGVIQQFTQRYPDNDKAKFLLLALMQNQEPEAALALIEQYIDTAPKRYDFQFAQITMQLKQNQLEAALANIKTIIATDADGIYGRKAKMILANYAYQSNDNEEVSTLLSQVLALAPEHEEALLLQARVFLDNQQADSAINVLRVVLRNNPKLISAKMLLSSAYIARGLDGLAEDNYREVLVIEPGNKVAALYVAQRLMRTNNTQRADAVISQALAYQTTDSNLLQALAQVKLAQNDWSATRLIVEQIKQAEPDSLIALYIEGRILQGKEKFQAAIDLYQSILKKNSNITVALEQLTNCYLQLGQEETLLQYLHEFLNQSPDMMTVYYLLSELYIRRQQWQQAQDIIRQGLNQQSKWKGGYLLLANIYRTTEQYDAVTTTYQDGLAAFPDDEQLIIPLAMHYAKKEQYTQAKQLYEQVLARNPSIPLVRNNLAVLLTEQFASKANLARAVELTTDFEYSAQPYYMDTYAWALAKTGQLQRAKSLLQQVTTKASDIGIFHYHLAYVHQQLGEDKEAKSVFTKAKSLAQETQDISLIEKIDKALSL